MPWAVLLFSLGGWGWVVWGISVRLVLSQTGHWLVGYLAHNGGEEKWRVRGASVQGYNLKGIGWLTMGESWHNNHHAFPRSSRLGFGRQADPGWYLLLLLHRFGMVWDLQTPESLPLRGELEELPRQGSQASAVES